MKEGEELTGEIEQTPEEIFRNRLGAVVSFLESGEIDYRVTGSVGACGILGVKFNPLKEDGTLRDMDFLLEEGVSQPVIKKLHKLADPIYFCLGLNRRIRLCPDGSGYLDFWGRRIPVNREALRPNKVNVLGVEIKSLSPEALFHAFALYSVLAEEKMVREKNLQTFYGLGRLVKRTKGAKALASEDFEPFHQFLFMVEEANKKKMYRGLMRVFGIYNQLVPPGLKMRIPEPIKEPVRRLRQRVVKKV